jgi:hypothetical protein
MVWKAYTTRQEMPEGKSVYTGGFIDSAVRLLAWFSLVGWPSGYERELSLDT